MLIVQKFGGSSVADAEKIRRVAGIIADTYEEGNDVVVVLSAQGDTTEDLLEKAAELNERPSKRELAVVHWGAAVHCLDGHVFGENAVSGGVFDRVAGGDGDDL